LVVYHDPAPVEADDDIGEKAMKILTTALATFMLVILSYVSATASERCTQLVEVTGASGSGVSEIPAVLCSGPAVVLLERAEVRDSLFHPSGKFMTEVHLDAISSGEMTDVDLYRASAKLIDVEFRAGSIIAFTYAKLREKIERYMDQTYAALYGQPVPLIRVRISALFPMTDGSQAVVYGTEVRNDYGLFGPGFIPDAWTVWRLHPSLNE